MIFGLKVIVIEMMDCIVLVMDLEVFKNFCLIFECKGMIILIGIKL